MFSAETPNLPNSNLRPSSSTLIGTASSVASTFASLNADCKALAGEIPGKLLALPVSFSIDGCRSPASDTTFPPLKASVFNWL